MATYKKVIYILCGIIIVGSAIYTLTVIFNRPNVSNQQAQERSEQVGLDQSIAALDVAKRPQVSEATKTLDGFFKAMYNYDNQADFEARPQKAEKYATNSVIKHAEKLSARDSDLVFQLNQESKFDQQWFFPNTVEDNLVKGRVLVQVTTTQSPSGKEQKGPGITGYDVTVDTNSHKVTAYSDLNKFNLQASSDALEND